MPKTGCIVVNGPGNGQRHLGACLHWSPVDFTFTDKEGGTFHSQNERTMNPGIICDCRYTLLDHSSQLTYAMYSCIIQVMMNSDVLPIQQHGAPFVHSQPSEIIIPHLPAM